MADTLHDIGNLSDNQYTLERTPDGEPALRLHIKGERTSAYILVEPGVEPGKYLWLDMPQQDRRVLRRWMKNKRQKV